MYKSYDNNSIWRHRQEKEVENDLINNDYK